MVPPGAEPSAGPSIIYQLSSSWLCLFFLALWTQWKNWVPRVYSCPLNSMAEFHIPNFDSLHPLNRLWFALMLWQIIGLQPAQPWDLIWHYFPSRHVSCSYSILSLTPMSNKNGAVPFYIHLPSLEKISSSPQTVGIYLWFLCLFQISQALGCKLLLLFLLFRMLFLQSLWWSFSQISKPEPIWWMESSEMDTH